MHRVKREQWDKKDGILWKMAEREKVEATPKANCQPTVLAIFFSLLS